MNIEKVVVSREALYRLLSEIQNNGVQLRELISTMSVAETSELNNPINTLIEEFNSQTREIGSKSEREKVDGAAHKIWAWILCAE